MDSTSSPVMESRTAHRALALVLALALFCAVWFPTQIWAKPDGSRVTFFPHAGVIDFSDFADLDIEPHAGSGFGFMFNRYVSIEGLLGFNNGHSDVLDSDVLVRHLGVDLRYHPLPRNRFNPYLLAGWSEFRFEPDNSGQVGDYNGWEFGGGITMALRDGPRHRISLRVDGRDEMAKFNAPLPDDGSFHHNFAVTAGIQVEFGDDWHKDTDGDGVIDRFDLCPDTDIRIVVDAKGCPIDSDQDGVFDGIDECQDTLSGAVVDTIGCPIDSDQDGIFDGLDQCEDTPDGAVIDAHGCPIDSDQDGIFDGLDQCENTPAGIRIDRQGCPTIDSQRERDFYKNRVLVFSNIEFESGKAELKDVSKPPLRLIGDVMRKWPAMKVEIGGYTDSWGPEDFNQKLSKRRAEAVRDYLVETFSDIRPDRFSAVGYGEASPIADNNTEQGRAQNRRVEVKIVEGAPSLNLE